MPSPDLDDISSWQYELPAELIASRPSAQRDQARLMVIDRKTGEIRHTHVNELPQILRPKDRLVLNNTKVLAARLFGFRTQTGGRWEGLFLEVQPDEAWRITGQTRGRLQPGESLTLIPAGTMADRSGDGLPSDGMLLHLQQRLDDGSWIAVPERSEPAVELLEQFGTLPLPPYIGRQIADADDQQRYQTVFASEHGAIAAPTAGLHFTPELLQTCRDRGIRTSEVTLHVGIGTFRPVSTSRLSDHQLHSEWCRVTQQCANDILETKREQGRIVAVGTTSVRTLEAAADPEISAWQGATRLFIRPGYQFRAVDQLLTNFHLPGSTLIVLVAALAGYDLTMEAYRKAVENRYRFYSYGDAMLIL